jgi:hypothetical protein
LEYRETGRVEPEVQFELGADAPCVVSRGDGSQVFGNTFSKLIVPFESLGEIWRTNSRCR